MESTHLASPAGPATAGAIDWLLCALGAGERCGRDLKAEAKNDGISPKALRKGREVLSVHVTRIGRRREARALWSLQSASPRASAASIATAIAEGSLTDGGRRLARVRMFAFIGRGMSADEASTLATRLAVERDALPGEHAMEFGSCIECQHHGRATCPVQPRAVAEIHRCLYMRHSGP